SGRSRACSSWAADPLPLPVRAAVAIRPGRHGHRLSPSAGRREAPCRAARLAAPGARRAQNVGRAGHRGGGDPGRGGALGDGDGGHRPGARRGDRRGARAPPLHRRAAAARRQSGAARPTRRGRGCARLVCALLRAVSHAAFSRHAARGGGTARARRHGPAADDPRERPPGGRRARRGAARPGGQRGRRARGIHAHARRCRAPRRDDARPLRGNRKGAAPRPPWAGARAADPRRRAQARFQRGRRRSRRHRRHPRARERPAARALGVRPSPAQPPRAGRRRGGAPRRRGRLRPPARSPMPLRRSWERPWSSGRATPCSRTFARSSERRSSAGRPASFSARSRGGSPSALPRSPGDAGARRRRWLFAAAASLGLGLLVLLVALTDARALLATARGVPPAMLAVPMALTLLSYAAMARSYQGIADAAGSRLSFRTWLRLTFVSNTANYVVTSAGLSGFAVRMFLLAQQGVPSGRAVLISLVQTFLTNATLLCFVLAGFVSLVSRRELSGGPLLAAAAAIVAFVGLLVLAALLVARRRLRRRLLRRGTHLLY